MKLHQVWRLKCKCGAERLLDIDNIVTAAAVAKRDGWVVLGYGPDRCPACIEREEELRESVKEQRLHNKEVHDENGV